MLLLWNVGGERITTKQGGRSLGQQFRDLGGLFRNRGLVSLIVVSGVRGMGDRGLLLFLPIYLAEELNMGSFMQGVHLSLLTAAAIVCGPLIGVLSDRIGRKPVMVGVMAVSAVLASLMIVGNSGAALIVLVALLGTVMFSINSLVQAAAMDLGEGKRLEGSLIGLLWGQQRRLRLLPAVDSRRPRRRLRLRGHLPLLRRPLPRRRPRGHQPPALRRARPVVSLR